MRGDRDEQFWALTPLTPESFVPEDHPIRALRRLADAALSKLSPTFRTMYAPINLAVRGLAWLHYDQLGAGMSGVDPISCACSSVSNWA